ncbi:RagB/SusD family nutrient uptake outer membrane protein [Siphonobacter sp. BAB-5385]|nr:RagB/SusD family nutrient uptake outer membrane protein [Siphonobacter sp. BAB-5385]PMD92338.1 RagB/SusD family nutrient uptake outer membrane protein [Siphonobacter sp. BAB-5405]
MCHSKQDIPMKSIFRFPLFITLAGLSLASCEKFVSIDYPPTVIGVDDAFGSDASATSVVLNMYSTIRSNPTIYWTVFGGLLSDELEYTPANPDLEQFESSTVSPLNTFVSDNIWFEGYRFIRQANMAIEGISKSQGMTEAGKKQLLGESKFWRAYALFHLVNYFGDVPLTVSSDEFLNAGLPRTPAAQVWAQVITDLKDAKASLPTAYIGSLRTRINKHTASALLARAYLYTKDYTNAAAEASEVIGSGTYSLGDLSATFINNSNETIFQTATLLGFTRLGANYRTSNPNVAPGFVLKSNFVRSFEAGDKRRTAWVDSMTIGSTVYQRINKYKLQTATAGNENNVMFRLAELYLIRAEAQANLNQFTTAKADLDIVRNRAGLPASTATTQSALLAAILQERKVELFGEFGHRWFDLKRTNQADAVLAPIKPGWKATGVLMPIPSVQIQANPVLTQNPGY